MQYSHKLTVRSCLFISSALLTLSGDAWADTSSATYTVTTELKEQAPGCTIQIKSVDFGSLYASEINDATYTVENGLMITCTGPALVSYPVIEGINTFENDACKFAMKSGEVEDGAIGFTMKYFYSSIYRNICTYMSMPENIKIDAASPYYANMFYMLYKSPSIEPTANQTYIARPTVRIEYQ